jgi:ubiquinol-cytochrome c reductase subunit 10
MVAYLRGPVYKKLPNLLGMNPAVVRSYIPNLILWGGAAGAGVAVFTEGVPLFQNTFYSKIPVFGEHWIYNPDPEEIPV